MVAKDQATERQGRVTILDVAAVAGVSKSTVSRILDERLPRSDSDTARRVRQVAADLGYFRDVSAASLRRGKTGTIGVIVPRLTDTVMAMLYEAVAQACAKRGLFAIVATTNDDPAADRAAAERLMRQGVDGLVLSTTRDDDDMAQELADRGISYVLTLRTDGKSLSSVGDDDFGGYLATRHLLDLGHRRIGIIAGPDYASSSRGRLEGYRRAMAEANIAVDPAWVAPSSFDIDTGGAAAERLMTGANPPTAIFAINDNTAIGAMSKLTQMGLSVPEDVSLVGYNDIPIVCRLPTPLTTVRVPFDQVAIAALDLLEASPPSAADRIRRVTPTLIPRKSTVPPKRGT
ncbi:substrate-binding domain-containing protein [Pleomorphomonas sp. JP5]|uniref:LacI family DNA-binding transcriptional regulator n=1 Tax=Pleomorphomonas sp. JP5 TaxID=2942998 RepID=UPI00204436F3|nr:substrate-binding domain-containing protein [Pleomorphomonas sp. JP5]MCM5557522.1 LacI family transcriptional regulator [Pleomorphomonas sp. JP5]